MKKIIWLLTITLFITACNNSKKEDVTNFNLTGTIKGLKKGTLYLKKIEQGTFTVLDSIVLYDTSKFTLNTVLKEPEVLYLYLDKLDNNIYNDFIPFFAEPGTVTVHTSLQKFKENAKITGAKNQTKLNEYNYMKKRFDTKNLQLMTIDYEAQKQKDIPKLQETEKALKSNAIRKYLYTVNFAINNKNLEVAPYLILSEIPDASINYLDTIINSLDSKILHSKYGKELTLHLQNKKASIK